MFTLGKNEKVNQKINNKVTYKVGESALGEGSKGRSWISLNVSCFLDQLWTHVNILCTYKTKLNFKKAIPKN